jgi:hypothetical protein
MEAGIGALPLIGQADAAVESDDAGLCTSLERGKKRLHRPPDASGVCAAPSLRFITGHEDAAVADDVALRSFSDAIVFRESGENKKEGAPVYLPFSSRLICCDQKLRSSSVLLPPGCAASPRPPSVPHPIMGSDSSDNIKNDPLAPFLKSIGEDCDRPACDDTKSALTAALGRVNAAKKKKGEKQPGGYTACPPGKDEIGVSTWTLLHSMVSGTTGASYSDYIHIIRCITSYQLIHT